MLGAAVGWLACLCMNQSSVETLLQATKLIESEGCYFGIFDSASPANVSGKWVETYQAAKQLAAGEEWSALLHFNQSWIDLAKQRFLLSWITVFDGVFKVDVRLLAEKPNTEFGAAEHSDFLGEEEENLLYCPSGNIVVDNLIGLGSNPIAPLVTITPGTYRVAFLRNSDEESKHVFLEDRSKYPDDEGPDWLIYMQQECIPVPDKKDPRRTIHETTRNDTKQVTRFAVGR